MAPRRPIVVVTGATGRLGRILSDRLARDRAAWEVLGTWHRRRPVGLARRGVTWMRFELHSPEPLVERLRGRRAVIVHMACTMSNDMNICFPHDCLGAMRLARALRTAVDQALVIYASSVSAAVARTDYGLAKRFVEHCLRDTEGGGIEVQIVRLPRMSVDGMEGHAGRVVAERLLLQRMNVSARIAKWLRSQARHA